MKRKLIYSAFIISALLLIHFLVRPYLFNLVRIGELSEHEFRLYYITINLVVELVLAVIIFLEGKYISGIQQVSMLYILAIIMDFNRMKVYPAFALGSNITAMFAGILIFSFGLVSIKKAIFKKGAGIFFFFLGAVYILRFPMFMDILNFYLNKFPVDVSPAEGYFLGTLYLNYLIILFGIFALNALINENLSMDRYTSFKRKDYYTIQYSKTKGNDITQ